MGCAAESNLATLMAYGIHSMDASRAWQIGERRFRCLESGRRHSNERCKQFELELFKSKCLFGIVWNYFDPFLILVI